MAINANNPPTEQIQPILETTTDATQQSYSPVERYSGNNNGKPVVLNPNATNLTSNPTELQSTVIVNGQTLNGRLSVDLPDDNPNLWDTCTIICDGGTQFYYGGIVTVQADRSLELDKKIKAPGNDGYPVVSKGYKNAEIKLHFKAWMPDHFVWYNAIADFFNFRSNPVGAQQQRNAVQINHPVLNLMHINNMVIHKVSCLTHEGGTGGGNQGMWNFEIDAIEWIHQADTRRTGSATHRAGAGSATAPNAIAPLPGTQLPTTRPATTAPLNITLDSLGL